MSIPSISHSTLGQNIHHHRIARSFTQAQFSEALDISIVYLSYLEHGKRGMSLYTLSKLCMHFHISADDILFGPKPACSEKAQIDQILKYSILLTQKELIFIIAKLKQVQQLQRKS